MGTLHDTVGAVKTLIENGTFSVSFDTYQSYDTELLLEDADSVRVDVVAGGMSCVSDSRVSLAYECDVDIALRYRFGVAATVAADGSIDIDDIEDYLDVLEEIGEYLADPDNRSLATKTSATWLRNTILMPWVPEHLRTNRQYTGILRATYRVAKDL